MLSIRKSIPEDEEALKNTSKESFIQASLDDFGDENVKPPGVNDGTVIDKGFNKYDQYTFLWEDKIVGGMIIEENETQDNFLHLLWVTTKFHNKGIGKKAIAFMEDKYPNTKSWNLNTPDASKRNVRFYEKLGYKKVGEQTFNDGKVVLNDYKKIMK